MPLFNPGPSTSPGMHGTVANIVQNLQGSYAPPGPAVNPASVFALQTAYLSANPIGSNPSYGSLARSSGDARGGGLLNGTSGAML